MQTQLAQVLEKTNNVNINRFNHRESFDLKSFLEETSQTSVECAELFQQLHQILEDK